MFVFEVILSDFWSVYGIYRGFWSVGEKVLVESLIFCVTFRDFLTVCDLTFPDSLTFVQDSLSVYQVSLIAVRDSLNVVQDQFFQLFRPLNLLKDSLIAFRILDQDSWTFLDFLNLLNVDALTILEMTWKQLQTLTCHS